MHEPLPENLPIAEEGRFIIFTDLDGSLLDHHYSWKPAQGCLAELRRHRIPVVICTSKTRGEAEKYRHEMGLVDPFIVENGGAIFIPQGYFSLIPFKTRDDGVYHIIESDIPYARLLATLEEIKRGTAPQAVGFSDLNVDRLAEITGLSRQEAILAKKRQYDEPFLVPEGEPPIERLRERIEEMGLNYIRGTRFHHIAGPHDKGTAVQKLLEIFRRNDPKVFSVGLGDGPNDIPFLERVDLAIVLPTKEGKYQTALGTSDYLKAPAAGPRGWSLAVRGGLGSYP
jgi:mannosyl-3-phosphoglycerate phosphatase